MWLLISTTDRDLKFAIVGDHRFVVGRQFCDIVIPDASVSRKQAVLMMAHYESNVAKSFITPTLTLEDISKFGTFVNGKPVKNPGGNTLTLKSGDQIKFGGSPASVFKAIYQPFIVTTSCLEKGPKKLLQKVICALGGHLVRDWRETCDLLIMSKINVTIKVICALNNQKHIVLPQYLDDLLQHLMGKRDRPKQEDYLPEVVDQEVPEGVSFHPDPRRATLLGGLKFYFLSAVQFNKTNLAVSTAGGQPILQEDGTEEDVELMAEEGTVVVSVTREVLATLSPSCQKFVKLVFCVLRKHNLRMVTDPEIGWAILTCNTTDFCNPKSSLTPSMMSAVASQSLTQQLVDVAASQNAEVKPDTKELDVKPLESSVKPDPSPEESTTEDTMDDPPKPALRARLRDTTSKQSATEVKTEASSSQVEADQSPVSNAATGVRKSGRLASNKPADAKLSSQPADTEASSSVRETKSGSQSKSRLSGDLFSSFSETSSNVRNNTQQANQPIQEEPMNAKSLKSTNASNSKSKLSNFDDSDNEKPQAPTIFAQVKTRSSKSKSSNLKDSDDEMTPAPSVFARVKARTAKAKRSNLDDSGDEMPLTKAASKPAKRKPAVLWDDDDEDDENEEQNMPIKRSNTRQARKNQNKRQMSPSDDEEEDMDMTAPSNSTTAANKTSGSKATTEWEEMREGNSSSSRNALLDNTASDDDCEDRTASLGREKETELPLPALNTGGWVDMRGAKSKERLAEEDIKPDPELPRDDKGRLLRNMCVVEAVDLVVRQAGSKVNRSTKAAANNASANGRQKNFKRFRKTRHAGAGKLPTIIGGRDLEVHMGKKHQDIEDLFSSALQNENQREEEEKRENELFNWDDDIRKPGPRRKR